MALWIPSGSSGNPLFSVSTSQTLVPVADISTGNWSATPGGSLSGVLDEVNPDYSDFISTANPSPTTCEVRFSAPSTTPSVTTGHVVKYILGGTMFTPGTPLCQFPFLFSDLLYGNGIYVGVDYTDYKSHVSSDLVSWIDAPVPLPGDGVLLFNAGKFFWFLYASTDYYTSTDGLSWSLGGTVPLATGEFFSHVAVGNGRMLVISDNPTLVSSAYSDNNGATWTSGASCALPNATGYSTGASLVYFSGKFVIFSNLHLWSNFIDRPYWYFDSAYSADGVSAWSTTVVVKGYPTPVIHKNTLVVAYPGVSSVSSDGVNWTTYLFRGYSGLGSPSLASNGVLLYLIHNNLFYSSPDGVTWAVSGQYAIPEGGIFIRYINNILVAQTSPGALFKFVEVAPLVVSLKCGSTTIASWYHTLTEGDQCFYQTLTPAQAANITDYSNLRLTFTRG